MILVDAGPLVAPVHADDRHHARCKEALEALSEPMSTVWPALVEAMYLLGFSARAQDALWEMVESGVPGLLPLDAADIPRMRELMRKYRDLPMDLADAALVRAAEREGIGTIFTVDARDFRLYRPLRIGRFRIIP